MWAMYIEQAKNAKWCTKDPLFVISRNQLLQLVQKGKTFFFCCFIRAAQSSRKSTGVVTHI